MKKIWVISALLGMLTAAVLFLFLSKPDEPAEQAKESVEELDSTVSDASEEEESDTSDVSQSNLPITYGKRAITVAVDDIQGIAGSLKKDDYVDVISLTSNGESGFLSQIVLQQIKVLAAGSYRPYTPAAPVTEADGTKTGASADSVQPDQASSSETTGPTDSADPQAAPEVALPYAMVTLEVLPDEGAKLALASSSGELVLMLRPRKDPTETEPKQFTTDQLIKGEIVK